LKEGTREEVILQVRREAAGPRKEAAVKEAAVKEVAAVR
jgi:hypothetical protein